MNNIDRELFGTQFKDPRVKLVKHLISYFPHLVNIQNGIAQDFNNEKDEAKRKDYAAQISFVEFFLHMHCSAMLLEKEWLSSLNTPRMNTIIKEVQMVYDHLEQSRKDINKQFKESALKGEIEA